MIGGAWEYVMGVMKSQDNQSPCIGYDISSNSGFSGPYCYTDGSLLDGISDFPTDKRYFDTYGYVTDDEHYNRRILGDATGEMGPFADRTYGFQTRKVGSWYDDESLFFTSEAFFLSRGGVHTNGHGSGLFSFHLYYGSAYSWVDFRVVLSI